VNRAGKSFLLAGGTRMDEKLKDGCQPMSVPDKKQVGIRSGGCLGGLNETNSSG
jgi:hypothetical protein